MSDLSTEIMRFLNCGYTNERIFTAIGWDTPQVFENDLLRLQASKGQPCEYDPKAAHDLMNLIRVNRTKFKDIQEREEKYKQLEQGGMIPLDLIETGYTSRIDTGFNKINRVFGSSFKRDSQGNVIFEESGIPRGKIILIGGEKGVGKTRFYTALAAKLVSDQGLRVGVAQTEMSMEEYKELVMGMFRCGEFSLKGQNRFLIGDKKMRNLKDQLKAIDDYHPDLWVVDSYQMIRGANSKSGIEDIIFYLKEAIGSHTSIFLITHLNAKGAIKGDNHLQYLVDVCMTMKKELQDGLFSLCAPDKNRSGPTGQVVYFKHVNGLVHVVLDDKAPSCSLLPVSSGV